MPLKERGATPTIVYAAPCVRSVDPIAEGLAPKLRVQSPKPRTTDGRRVRMVVARVEQAARRRAQSEQLEVAGVDRLSAQPLGPVARDRHHAHARRADRGVEGRQHAQVARLRNRERDV